jgi:hypothetical protein
MRLFKLLFVIIAGAFAGAGCVGSGTADVQYSGAVTVETPDLVEVSPGVQVVADYDESIFYSDGFYWRYDSGGWYRSSNYAGGFVYWESPPSAVISIGQPERFRHYRPTGYVAHRRATVRPEPIRDHRQVRNERVEQPAPVVRDHREPMPPEQRPVEQRREEPRREQPRPVEQRREEPMRREQPARPEPPRAEPQRREEPARQAPPPREAPPRDKHDDKKKH